jgi:hypothetical protein
MCIYDQNVPLLLNDIIIMCPIICLFFNFVFMQFKMDNKSFSKVKVKYSFREIIKHFTWKLVITVHT